MPEKSTINISEGFDIQCSGCPTKFIPNREGYSIKEESESHQGGVWLKHFILSFKCPTCHAETEIGYWGGVKNKS